MSGSCFIFDRLYIGRKRLEIREWSLVKLAICTNFTGGLGLSLVSTCSGSRNLLRTVRVFSLLIRHETKPPAALDSSLDGRQNVLKRPKQTI